MTEKPDQKSNNKKKVTIKEIDIQDKKQQQDKQNKQEIHFCNFCNKKAQFVCGNCDEAYYCTFEHQKADWTSHKKKCVKPEYRLREMKKQAINLKKNFFDKLCRGLMNENEVISDDLMQLTEQTAKKFPSPFHQIEYGASVCTKVRFLISVKNFNEAQEILNMYMKNQDSFIRSTDQIPSKLDKEDPLYAQKLSFVEEKLKLISALCNLAHQSVRNAISVIEILLEHMIKFYGPQSMQVSNIYFELANYFNFMNQPHKAIACFLLASKIRKQKGISCLYNTAILFLRHRQYHNAIKFFYQTLEMIETYGDQYKITHTIYSGLGYAFKKLNHFDLTVQNFQKALCQLNSKKNVQRERSSQTKVVKEILKKLSAIYQKQFEDGQTITLPNEKSQIVGPKPVLTNHNLEQLWELQKDNSQTKKRDQWTKSFKNQVDKTKFKSKIPMTNNLVQKMLFENQFIEQKNEDLQLGGVTTDIVKMDLGYMFQLTSAEVRYMHELNRMLFEVKDREAIYDIVENSNLMQTLNEEKTRRFFEINPKLKRKQDDKYEFLYQDKKNKLKPGDEALKLNLKSLPKNS